jgi:hypothetical protein
MAMLINLLHRKRAASGMLRRLAFVRTYVMEGLSACIIRVTGEIGKLAVTSNRRTL